MEAPEYFGILIGRQVFPAQQGAGAGRQVLIRSKTLALMFLGLMTTIRIFKSVVSSVSADVGQVNVLPEDPTLNLPSMISKLLRLPHNGVTLHRGL